MDIGEIRRLLIAGQLMSADSVDAAMTGFKVDGGGSDDEDEGDEFVKYLIERQTITGFQGRAILHGVTGPYHLGPYRVYDRIVVGRLGNVFRAVHEEFDQAVGLKLFSESLLDDPGRSALLARETRVAVQVNHPDTVRTFQIGRIGDMVFLAIEDLQGETLAEKLDREEKLPLLEAFRVMRHVAMALEHLHSLDIIHCDIHPDNIWLSTDGRAKLMEFSAAHQTQAYLDMEDLLDDLDELLADEELSKELLDTVDFHRGGSYAHMPPEQGADENCADARSDIYALGSVLFQCLTGELPFQDENPVRQMLRKVYEPARPMTEIDEDFPEAAAKVVATMLAQDPKDRYQHAKDVVWALEQLLTSEVEHAIAVDEISREFLQWVYSSAELEEPDGIPLVAAEPEFIDFFDWLAAHDSHDDDGVLPDDVGPDAWWEDELAMWEDEDEDEDEGE